jgi:ATP-dependent helicase/DNAse subunit B
VHKTLSPTGIESFLQCPFQFFAGKTLRLRRRPPVPRDRLDVLLQGSILHRALAEWTRAPLLGSAILDQVFEEECARLRVPEGYRTEAVRLELMRNFRGFLEDRQFALSWSTRVEEKFSYPLNPLVNITGRIDRLDVGSGNQALVIDYKYSAGNKIKERVEDTGEGHLVQGGLYLAAARAFGLDPAGMLFCGLKKDVTWDGWHVSVPGLETLGTSTTREVLRALIDDAEGAAVRVHEAITSGNVAVHPRDPLKCQWCDFCDICRVESAALLQAGNA